MANTLKLKEEEKRVADPKSPLLESALKENNVKFERKGNFYIVEDMVLIPMEKLYYGNIRLLWPRVQFINECSKNGKRILILPQSTIKNNPYRVLKELKEPTIISELGI
jgi:hypothetical protein